MENQKLLGIYIPTNGKRIKEMGECLVEFIKQLKTYNYPIYIADQSDNAEVKNLVNNLRHMYHFIYCKHFKASNYANNVKNVSSMGNTKFMWLFGDDDTIKKDAINIITKELKKNIYFIQINSEARSQDLQRVIKPRLLKLENNEDYSGGEFALLANKGGDYQGFMAQMIIKKDIFDKELKKLDANADNMDYIHTIAFYRAMANKNGEAIAKPLINNRGANWGYSKRIIEIYFNSWNLTHKMLEGYYPNYVIAEVRKRSLFNLMIPIAINTVVNQSSPMKTYNIYIKNDNDIEWYKKPILFLGLLIPKIVMKSFFEIFKRVKGY